MKSKKYLSLLFIALIILCADIKAQEKVDVDELFKQARSVAFNQKDYAQAREISKKALEQTPDYHDIRIFTGRLYAWEGKYSEARKEFNYVLSKDPSYKDAHHALVDAEMWAENYNEALSAADKGLARFPDDPQLLLKKARILYHLNEFDRSAEAVNRLLATDASNTDALSLMKKIKYNNYLFRLGGGHEVDIFERPQQEGYGPFHQSHLELGKHFSFGSVMARVNHAYRSFSREIAGKKDLQFEADAYPSIAKGLYAYLNAGFSPDIPIDNTNLFPRYRAGAELFKNLPKSFEASAGFRYLDFTYPGDSDNSKISIYTASAGKYIGNYWISARTFLRPVKSGSKISHSEMLFIRRYFESGASGFNLPYFSQSFIGLTAGRGSTPDRFNIEQDFTRLNSWQVGLQYQRIIAGSWVIRAGAGFQREQWNVLQPRLWGNRFNFDIMFQRLFFKAKYNTR